uniref:MI domain-containing protein n=1 Tax=Bracon brevicornis TaxID=1563983 RepID=A0A6V7IVL7_9HYME
MTLQYTLWDKLKTLEEYSNIQIRNLAKFLSHLFLERGLPLSVLKVVEFGELDKPTMRLIRQIMLTLFLHENSDECLKVFERISLAPQLQTFREGLRLFISHFLLKNADAKPLPEDQLEKLQSTAKLVDRILVTRAARTIF